MSARPPRERDRVSLRRLAGGDTSALETLWMDHADRLFRHALWVIRRREEAEDVVQTVFVRLAGLGSDLLGIRNLPAYLAAMAHREAVEEARRLADGPTPLVVDADDLLAAVGDPDDDLDRRRIAQRVSSLPLEQREAVFLHIWGGLSFREIGSVTGVSLFTAASRYRLAITRLRRLLKEDEG